MSEELTTPSSRSSTPRRGLKLPTGVFAVIVLMLLGGAGWFVWEQLKPEPARDLSQYEPINSPTAQGRARFRPRAGNPGGNPASNPNRAPAGIPGGGTVSVASDGTGNIRIDGARARFTKAGNGFKVDFFYIDMSFQPADDAGAITARFQALRDTDRAKAAGLTDDQIAKLRAIPYVREMLVSDAARQTALEQWTQYAAAAADQRKAIEPAMIDHLRKTASDAIPATLASIKSTADQIRAILSTEQIMRLRNERR